jgi:hypothetical protein
VRTREVTFECVFGGLSANPEPGQAVFVPLKASLTEDRLPEDDVRYVVVPVVAALPVVFVDQYGADEDAARGRLGETRHLRRLLAPRTSRADAPRQLIKVRHVAPGEVSRDVLADARLVVVAGVREPGAMAGLLADYVRNGGQLLIGAGVDFDPAAWQSAGWLEGNGILPLPLLPEPLGATPEEAGETLQPFGLSVESLTDERIFRLVGVSDAELQALYSEPFFFKTVRVDGSAATLSAQAAREERPARVLARFQNTERSIFLVSRAIGRGEVVFCASGLLSSWNTLPKTNAVLMFDRLLRGMVQRTLPERNFSPSDQLTIPLPSNSAGLALTLSRPGQINEQPLEVSYTSASERGVLMTGLLERGVYWIRGWRGGAATAGLKPAWELPLAVGGESAESDLTAVGPREMEKLADERLLRWVAAGEPIDLAGDATAGQSTWWWLALVVLLLLVMEMSIIAFPGFATMRAGQ